MVFPVLSMPPDRDGFKELPPEGNVISTPMEDGYEVTRARFARRRRSYQVSYGQLSGADKTLLDAFVDSMQGSAAIFDWTHPITGESIAVRFTEEPEFDYLCYSDSDHLWKVSFTLREV